MDLIGLQVREKTHIFYFNVNFYFKYSFIFFNPQTDLTKAHTNTYKVFLITSVSCQRRLTQTIIKHSKR